MRRTTFSDDHEAFRLTVRDFIAKEVSPHYDEWYAAGQVPRELYYQLGELGIFGIEVPEEYGGAGITSFKYTAVQVEELTRAAVSFGGSGVHVALCLPYIVSLGTEEQKQRWLPPFVTGEQMWAIAMTEPGTGSDLAGMRTTAKLSDDGTHYVLNGAKTFITGGVLADRVIVCARTNPPRDDDRRFGISLLVVDTKSEGYTVGRKLDKLGLKTSDTAELAFQDVRTCSVSRTRASATSARTFRRNGSRSRSAPTRRRPQPWSSPRPTRSSAWCSASRSRTSRTRSSSWPRARPRSTLLRRSPTALSTPSTPVSSPRRKRRRRSCSAPRSRTA